MRQIIVLGLCFITITMWSNTYAQQSFTLTTWSLSVAEPVTGVMQDGPYTLTSGFLAVPPTHNHQLYLPFITR